MKNLVLLLLIVAAGTAMGTPSSNLWAPSTALCQAFAVPHLTYDSFFRKGPGMNSGHASAYPVDYGLTVGFLPFEKIQGEIGFDLFYPSEHPESVNGKLCTPEGSLFSGSPAISGGFYAVGFKKNQTNFDISYLMLQKSLNGYGSVAVGVYHGANRVLFTNSDGEVVQTGIMAAVISPDIEIGKKGLRKLNFLIDLQSGKNAYGAWAVGSNIYFAEHVSLLVGPTFFFDRKIQPDGADMLWAVELDVDIDFGN